MLQTSFLHSRAWIVLMYMLCSNSDSQSRSSHTPMVPCSEFTQRLRRTFGDLGFPQTWAPPKYITSLQCWPLGSKACSREGGLRKYSTVHRDTSNIAAEKEKPFLGPESSPFPGHPPLMPLILGGGGRGFCNQSCKRPGSGEGSFLHNLAKHL